MIKDYGLVVFRDRYGIKPLSYYEAQGDLITFSSETSGLNSTNFKDVLNGEIIIVNKNRGEKTNCLRNHNSMNIRPCLFEYIYFARQDSYINDILVYEFRKKIGIKIASIIDYSVIESVDFVLPVPQTSIISACSLANVINKPIEHAIIKNRYTHRTFINSGKEILENIKKIKVIEKIVCDKNVLVVDDSIVRGNTSKYIIEELKRAGVKKIYFACCSPPIIYPNVYGIAIPTTKELLAYGKTTKQIANILGVDQLYYLPLDIMCNTLTEINPNITLFENSVFTGNYI